MRISMAVFTMLMLALFPGPVRAGLIDFEDLTPTAPFGFPTDASGRILDGYQGFDWADYPESSVGNSRWASLEGFIAMPGTGTAYAYGQTLVMTRKDRDFDLVSLQVGSYFYTGQRIYLAGWDDGALIYHSSETIDASFRMCTFVLNYNSIDRFTLYAGSQGSLDVPFQASHVLCIDNISLKDDASSPVPEPSTLFILGAGILGFTSIYRKFTLPKNRDML